MNFTRLVYRTPVNIAEKYVYETYFKQGFLKISNLITLKSLFYYKFESFLQVARKRTDRCRTPVKEYTFLEAMNDSKKVKELQ